MIEQLRNENYKKRQRVLKDAANDIMYGKHINAPRRLEKSGFLRDALTLYEVIVHIYELSAPRVAEMIRTKISRLRIRILQEENDNVVLQVGEDGRR